jgi:diguanylate cyclase (GGDEF)-like protein/PAS domain S-box-containing protein
MVEARRRQDSRAVLRAASDAFPSFAENSPVGIYIVENGKFTYVNRHFELATGYDQDELLGQECLALVHPDDKEKVRESAVGMLKGYARTPYEYRILTRAGETKWILESVTPVKSRGRQLAIGYFNDVTERMRTEDELRSALALHAATIESTADGLLIVDGRGKILSFNQRFVEMWRLPLEVVASKDDDAAIGFVLDQLHDPRGFEDKVRSLYTQPDAESYDVLEFNDGRVFERYSKPTLIAGKSAGRVWSFRDVTERRRSEEKLIELANHDSLTSLINRRRFHEELESALTDPTRRGALLLLDLDQFKDVNDSLGHLAGDELLASVASVLREALPANALIARLGGDEFAVLLLDCDAARASNTADALLQRLSSQPLTAGGQPITISGSIGVALFPDHGTAANTLLSRVDLAMYQAKEKGRNRFCVYSAPRGADQAESRLAWVNRIREALRNDLFCLHAQPIVGLHGEGVNQYELLLRMKAEKGKLIPAGSFIDIAERSGMVQEIDKWVVREALSILSDVGRVRPGVRLAVNLSSKTLADSEVLVIIRSGLASRGIDPASLIVEVTEAAAVSDIARTRKFIGTLRAIGCRFALDDFGAGFSSFYHLKQLPVDLLKIDGSFIKELPRSAVDQKLVKAMVAMAGGLNMETVAEHVTDGETVELLRTLGVHHAQGYHLGRPQPMTDLLQAPELVA